MIAARAVKAGFTPTAAAKAMTSVAATISSELRGLHASASRDAAAGSSLQRLPAVPGSNPNRVNDLLLLRPDTPAQGAPEPQDSSRSNRHVVFFHGDIQNFQEEMALQSEGAQWLSWSLEQVALTLGRRFPEQHIWVVRASHMYLHKFSCYHNFVESNMFGAPDHSTIYSQDFGAFHHLRALLSHGMERADLPNPLRPQGGAGSVPSGFSLTLVGFSKGCVVLNQMLYELAGARADQQMSHFVESITDMFWLDGGHPGGSETWVTNKQVLKELAASRVTVHAHVTPYEVRDPMRAWVGREHGHFVKTLEEFGASPHQQLHFEDEPPSIENHFRVIQAF